MSYVDGTSGAVITDNIAIAIITNNGDGSFVIDRLNAGDRVNLTISLQIAADFMGTSIRNWAEISAADNLLDLDDVDSTPDDENFNQPGETDDLS